VLRGGRAGAAIPATSGAGLAAAHVDEGRWSFARSLCAFHGRSVARSALVGIGTAERLADLVEVRGAAQLDARGCLLLGFHLTLRRLTGAPERPVLSHFEARTHVVTEHPPLPVDPDDRRRALGELLGEYVRRYPEQCYSLAFPVGPPLAPPATR
jgi:hypothetical protein